MFSACASRFPTTSRLVFFLPATVAFNLFLAATAHAATYYVADNGGSDSNPGSQAAPFKTIAKGSRALAAGDFLLIRAGTYNEPMIHGSGGFVFRNGTASAYTRYTAYPGEQVIVKAPTVAHLAWFGSTSNYIELSGIILDGTNTTSAVVKIDGSYAKNQWPRIRLLRNDIRFGSRMGVYGGGQSEIIGNKIHHMGAYGIYTAGDNGLIEGNIVHDNNGHAIHLFQQNHTVNNWIIRNNILYRNGITGYRVSSTGNTRQVPAVIISRGRGHQFYNNLIYNNHAGIFVSLGAVDAFVANNTAYGNGEYGINVSSSFFGSWNTHVINNIAWGNRDAQILNTGTNTTLWNNLTTDPNFVNAATGDFGVQASSPAIDKGLTLPQVPDDFTGKKRPEGEAYDIGAFEGAGSRANVLPGMVGGLPQVSGGSVLRESNGEVCPAGYLTNQEVLAGRNRARAVQVWIAALLCYAIFSGLPVLVRHINTIRYK